MFGSPEIFPTPAVEYFFNCIPFKARCALSIFPVLQNALAEANRFIHRFESPAANFAQEISDGNT